MIATQRWLVSSGADFQASEGRDNYIDLKHYTARVRVMGVGRPLLLVPGLAGGLELLGPLAKELSRSRQVILPTLRGESDCFAMRRRLSIADLSQDLRELMDAMGLERPALAGVSFGGVIAADFASRFSNRISSLTLQGVGGRYERGLIQRIARLVLTAYPLPADSPFVNQFFNLLLGKGQSLESLSFVAAQCWRTDQSVIASRLRLVERCDLEDRLKSITVPTLVLSGNRDILVNASNLRNLCSKVRDCRSVVIADAGHLACVTHSKRLAAEIGNFLAQSR